MKVKVAKLGKSAVEITINKEIATVEDALKIEGIIVVGKEQVLLNGKEVKDFKTRIAEGAVITVVPKVKGGDC